MEVIYWVIIFLVFCILVSFIASKKGRSGVKLFFAMILPAALHAQIAKVRWNESA